MRREPALLEVDDPDAGALAVRLRPSPARVDPNPAVELVSVTSSEPDNGPGDGNTIGDIAGADLGTDDRSFQLRAERSGSGSGRTYTVVYKATDASGNVATASATVFVPKSRNG